MGGEKRGYTITHPEFTAGNSIARTHGATARDVPQEALAIVSDLVGEDTYRRHPELSLRAAETWTRIRRAEAFVAEHGDLDEEGKPRPVLAAMVAWDTALVKLSDRLGLSPLSAARLDVLRGDVRPGLQGDPGDRIVGMVVELQERHEKKCRHEEWLRERSGKVDRDQLGSPPRLALGPGPRVEVETVVVEPVNPIRAVLERRVERLRARGVPVDENTTKALEVLEVLEQRVRDREESDG